MSWLPSWTAPPAPPPTPPSTPGWADDEPTGPSPADHAPAPGNGWDALTETGLNADGTRFWQVPGYDLDDLPTVPTDQLQIAIELDRCCLFASNKRRVIPTR